MACCAFIKRCGTNKEFAINIGTENSSTYLFWFDLYDNGPLFTTTNVAFPGVYSLNSICCDCEDCTYEIQLAPEQSTVSIYNSPCPNYYTLRNCKTKETFTAESTTELSLLPFLGSVVNITSSNTNRDTTACWEVLELTANNPDEVVQITSSYKDCECCLGPEPPKYTRIEPAPNRVFYKMPSQCDIRTNTQFANAYYKLFKNLKYGINSECDIDTEKILIKKELADLAATLYLPACGAITPEPVPIICPEPS